MGGFPRRPPSAVVSAEAGRAVRSGMNLGNGPSLGGKRGKKCRERGPGAEPPSVPAGSGVALRKLCELRAGERCCVVGTLFKAMQLQPSILQEISEEVTAGAVPSPPGRGTRAGSWGRAGPGGGDGGAAASPSLAEPLPPWLTAAPLLASQGSAKWKQPRPARSWRAAPRAAGPPPGAAPACPDPKKPPPPGVPPSSPQHNLVPQPPLPKYVHPSDELILEDELQRIKLAGNVEVSKMVTGRGRRRGGLGSAGTAGAERRARRRHHPRRVRQRAGGRRVPGGRALLR